MHDIWKYETIPYINITAIALQTKDGKKNRNKSEKIISMRRKNNNIISKRQ